jgi:hypothetical protein
MTAPGAGADDAGTSFEWTYNPWREHPWLAAVGAALALGLGALVGSFGESPVLSIGLAGAGVAALAPRFAPTRCRVGSDGVARRGPLGWSRRRWVDIRRARLGREGMLVSPYPRAHFLEPYRALFLPLPGDRREALGAALRSELHARGLGR